MSMRPKRRGVALPFHSFLTPQSAELWPLETQ